MDKNSIFGIILIAAILIIWGVVQSPNKKELEARKKEWIRWLWCSNRV